MTIHQALSAALRQRGFAEDDDPDNLARSLLATSELQPLVALVEAAEAWGKNPTAWSGSVFTDALARFRESGK